LAQALTALQGWTVICYNPLSYLIESLPSPLQGQISREAALAKALLDLDLDLDLDYIYCTVRY
jgi:hypothetical protein